MVKLGLFIVASQSLYEATAFSTPLCHRNSLKSTPCRRTVQVREINLRYRKVGPGSRTPDLSISSQLPYELNQRRPLDSAANWKQKRVTAVKHNKRNRKAQATRTNNNRFTSVALGSRPEAFETEMAMTPTPWPVALVLCLFLSLISDPWHAGSCRLQSFSATDNRRQQRRRQSDWRNTACVKPGQHLWLTYDLGSSSPVCLCRSSPRPASRSTKSSRPSSTARLYTTNPLQVTSASLRTYLMAHANSCVFLVTKSSSTCAERSP